GGPAGRSPRLRRGPARRLPRDGLLLPARAAGARAPTERGAGGRRGLLLGGQFLPVDSLDIRLSPHFRGYIRLGAENTRGVVDFREQVEFGREEPPVPGRGLPPPERLRGPNLWPAEGHPPGFRARAEAFCEVMMDISWHLTRSLARSLGMPSQGFDGFIGERPHWQMKIVRYPPDEPHGRMASLGSPGRALGGRGRPLGLRLPDVCAAGRRASGLQAEVQGSPGTWMDVPPLGEDHLVVNLGEMLMLMTDGYYVATQHRVRSDPQRSRVSVPFFFNPSLAAVVKPLPADLLGRLPWERDRSLADSRRADERNAIFQDYGMNAFKSLFRSHPEVSARHHPDLELLPSGDVRLRGRPQSAAPGPVPHDRR
ncbi:unnamed protein product, partial [Prorocentrum cordatum]